MRQRIEEQIRDYLVENLNIIDRNITLVRKNYPLPNARGTRGAIDILARDPDGSLVVIEIKRSDSAAREALHEVMKYTELLMVEKGVAAGDIRGVVVSSEWEELRIPFGHFKRGWAHEIRGYHLALDANSIPVSATEVADLPEAPERGITRIQVALECRSAAECKVAWSKVVEVGGKVGMDDLIGIELTRGDGESFLYVALGRILAGDPRTEKLDTYCEDIPDDTTEAPPGLASEYRALTYICENYTDYLYSVAYPDKLTEFMQNGWKATSIWRAGIFNRQASLFPDSLVIGNIVSMSGQSQTFFAGRSRPANRRHWQQLLTRAEHCLVGAEGWRSAALKWLDEKSADGHTTEVDVRIFNPCSIISTLIFGSPDSYDQYLPSLESIAVVSGDAACRIRGFITWSGKDDFNLSDVVTSYYPDPSFWGIARAVSSEWEQDESLMRSLGLEYMLLEDTSTEKDVSWFLHLEDDNLERLELSEGNTLYNSVRPVSDFLDRYADEIAALSNLYKAAILD